MNAVRFAILFVLFAGCTQGVQTNSPFALPAGQQDSGLTKTHLDGEGSVVIQPLLSAWIDEYSRTHVGIRISYLSRGSGRAIHKLIDGKIFFAVSVWPLADADLARVPSHIVHFPLALHAAIPAYNLPGVSHLRFSGTTLANIFMGKITKWDDPALASDNPGVRLPRMEIKVAHHFPSDGQPDTFIMADYLSKVSPAFKAALANSSVWPVSDASAEYIKGAGMMGFIAETPGSIGYIDFVSARFNRVRCGAVKNSDGEFVMASPESLTSASEAAAQLLQQQMLDFGTSITNAPGKKSYPIASFVWLLFREDSTEKLRHDAMVDFLKWALTDGQKLVVKLGYPPLPDGLIKLELAHLGTDGPKP